MRKILLACCILLTPFVGSAANKKNVTKEQKAIIKNLVVEFQLQKEMKQNELQTLLSRSNNGFARIEQCDDDDDKKGSCINAVCAKMPSYKCDDVSELKEVAEMCVNNKNGECVTAVCSKMPAYNCDDVSELKEIAFACRDVDGECVSAACSYMPNYNCDDLSETKEIALACKGLEDGGCVEAICSHMPAYNCDDISEIKEVIKSCKGQ